MKFEDTTSLFSEAAFGNEIRALVCTSFTHPLKYPGFTDPLKYTTLERIVSVSQKEIKTKDTTVTNILKNAPIKIYEMSRLAIKQVNLPDNTVSTSSFLALSHTCMIYLAKYQD